MSRKTKPGIVAHTCNPSYLIGRDQGGSKFKASPGKNVLETPSQPTEARYIYNPSHKGSKNRKITVQGGLGIRQDSIQKQPKQRAGEWSSGRVPV
jgi:hypothetical protein